MSRAAKSSISELSTGLFGVLTLKPGDGSSLVNWYPDDNHCAGKAVRCLPRLLDLLPVELVLGGTSALSRSRPKRRVCGLSGGIGEMSMATGEGARDADGELSDMLDAKDSSRSEERKSSISLSGRLVCVVCDWERGEDGAGLKKAMSSCKVDICADVKDRCREESRSVEKVNMFRSNATRSRDGKDGPEVKKTKRWI